MVQSRCAELRLSVTELGVLGRRAPIVWRTAYESRRRGVAPHSTCPGSCGSRGVQKWLAAEEAVETAWERVDTVLQLTLRHDGGEGCLQTHRNWRVAGRRRTVMRRPRGSSDRRCRFKHRRHRLTFSPLERSHQNPRAWSSSRRGADLIEHERVTIGIFVPTMLQMLTRPGCV